MAWDNSLPIDNQKLRTLASVIRDNFVAIEEGLTSFQPKSLNYTNRTVSGPSDDPSLITDAYLLYCKDDDVGNAELYSINEDGGVSQLTSGTASAANTANISSFVAGGVKLKMGNDTYPAGNSTKAITFTSAFATTCYGVLITPQATGVTPYAESLASTGFTAKRTGIAASVVFSWMAWGD